MKKMIIILLILCFSIFDIFCYENIKNNNFIRNKIIEYNYDDYEVIELDIINYLVLVDSPFAFLTDIKSTFSEINIGCWTSENFLQEVPTQLQKYKVLSYYLYAVDITYDDKYDFINYGSYGYGLKFSITDFYGDLLFCNDKTLFSYENLILKFCIINGNRGFMLKEPYLFDSNNYVFYKWSSSEQSYVLDESVTQEQLENAYCPEDYFAYNGLKFSKLDSKLTAEDLKDLDKAQLRLMRNAVYARHGRTFKSVDLQSLWNCYTWYKPNKNYSDELLTEVDKYNIELIQKFESK